MKRLLHLAVPLIASICILCILGCPGRKPVDKTKAGDTAGKVEEVNVSGGPVDVTQRESENEGQSVAETDLEPGLGTPVTGYKPTQEHPLAPPAPPAAGSENAPQGELTLAASLKGSDGKAAPITEGITVHVGDALNVQITLVNNSSEKKVIVFASSQKLDIEASNAAGKQVYRWSAGERFPQVVNSLELEAGTSWSHEVTIKIGAGENQLRPGKYNFAIMVTGTPQMALMAKNVTIAKD